jgi:hypothetical protein
MLAGAAAGAALILTLGTAAPAAGPRAGTGTITNDNFQLNAVSALSSSDAWAVGTGGRTLHWDGTSWSPVTLHGGSGLLSLSGVDAVSSRHVGTATPPPPESQSFWVARARGTHPTLTWTVTNGSYRVVAMNTDAVAPAAFAGALDLTIPHSFAIGIGLLIGGIVLILIAIMLIVLGARARARPQSRDVPDLATRP